MEPEIVENRQAAQDAEHVAEGEGENEGTMNVDQVAEMWEINWAIEWVGLVAHDKCMRHSEQKLS